MKLKVMLMAIPLFTTFVMAQDSSPRFAVFGGYSLEHVSACGQRTSGTVQLTCSFTTDSYSSPASYKGWDASATGFIYGFMGFTADLSGHYGTTTQFGDSASTSRLSYLFGPVGALRGKKWGTPFAHFLVGGVSNHFGPVPGGLVTKNYLSFAWDLGGGIDMNVMRHLAVRAAQLDYERVNVPGGAVTPVNGLRYASGLVLRF